MFEFRLRILDVRERETDPFSYLGLVEGFPNLLVHSNTASGAAVALESALHEFLSSLRRPDPTRIELDDFPTVCLLSLRVARVQGTPSSPLTTTSS